MKKIGAIIFLSIFILITLPSCESNDSCPQELVESYIDEIELILEEWDDTVLRAESASISTFPSEVEKLQEIKRKTRNIENPECANYINEILVIAMESRINTYIAALNYDLQRMVDGEQIFNLFWKVADEEFNKFKNSPEEAYESMDYISHNLPNSCEERVSSRIPESWQEHYIPYSDLVISFPMNFDFEEMDSGFFELSGLIEVGGKVYDSWESEYEAVTLLFTEKFLELLGIGKYSIQSYDCKQYNLNKVYSLEFNAVNSQNDESGKFILSNLITQDNQSILFILEEFDDEYDEQLGIVFSSVKSID